MVFTPVRNGRRRMGVLALSYVSLIAICALSWLAREFHVGAVAAIPLLFIAYYTRLPVALFTAFISGIVLTAVDYPIIPHGGKITISPVPDAIAFSITLCAVVVVAERLRRSTMQNVALSERLNEALTRADQDTLTGIGNRRFFLRRLRAAIHTMSGRDSVGVLFADLDGFKQVNDTSGHPIGDRVLSVAAERLRHAIRGNDTLARIGGDEFAILIERLPAHTESHSLIEKIEAEFTNPINVNETDFNVGITVGLAIAPDDGLDPQSLLRIADGRMYQKKEAKRSPRSLS
jgi:diguanylate cyclase (GGDEF)-like protein